LPEARLPRKEWAKVTDSTWSRDTAS